jgi:hypothetical protein
VYNYPKRDVYSYIQDGTITIHRADITSFDSHTINLSNGSIPADLLITATGFSAQPAIKFSPESIHSSLGLPSTTLDASQEKMWSQLTSEAESRIQAVFPRLIKGPFTSPKSEIVQPFHSEPDPNARYTPWRLYRSIAPPGPTAAGQHDLAFVGMFSNISNTVRLELQCLWAHAYLTNSLTIQPPSADEVYRETALWSRYWQLRAPYGHGRYYPDANFDQIPCFDMWMLDLGLKAMRKKNWLQELFAPYTQEDYRGVVAEWLASQKLKAA